MKLLLAGEGRTELGDWFDHPGYRPQPGEPRNPAVLEALLRRVEASGAWTVHDGVAWKSVKKFQAGNHQKPETRTVLGLALMAEERGCDALLFVRDRDRDAERQRDVEAGIDAARTTFQIAIVGGVAIEAIEAWILGLLGDRRSEEHRRPKVRLAEEYGCTGTVAMVNVIEAADLSSLSGDARSLADWMASATALLSRAG